MQFSKLNEVRRQDTQSGCESENDAYCRLPFTAFNQADEGPVDLCIVRKLLLR